LPSSIGKRWPPLNARIAPAVERPMPGSAATCSKVVGITPPCSTTMRCAARCRWRARA